MKDFLGGNEHTELLRQLQTRKSRTGCFVQHLTYNKHERVAFFDSLAMLQTRTVGITASFRKGKQTSDEIVTTFHPFGQTNKIHSHDLAMWDGQTIDITITFQPREHEMKALLQPSSQGNTK